MKRLKSKLILKGAVTFALAWSILLSSGGMASAADCGQLYIDSVTSPTCPNKYDCGPGSGLRTHFQYKNMKRKCVSSTNRIYYDTKKQRYVLGCC